MQKKNNYRWYHTSTCVGVASQQFSAYCLLVLLLVFLHTLVKVSYYKSVVTKLAPTTMVECWSGRIQQIIRGEKHEKKKLTLLLHTPTHPAAVTDDSYRPYVRSNGSICSG